MYSLGAIRELVAAGLDEAEAQAIVDAIRRISTERVTPLASRKEMRDDLLVVAQLLAGDVVASRRRTILWVLALHALLLAILVGIARFTDLL